ncbi:MAG: hypothetical protein V7L31_24725 [Nostoc sp.]|uniref:hypothetical protein n=1 Tax=Nostoc sp. TaxID=1180 RepID=UPI002FF2EE4C
MRKVIKDGFNHRWRNLTPSRTIPFFFQAIASHLSSASNVPAEQLPETLQHRFTTGDTGLDLLVLPPG